MERSTFRPLWTTALLCASTLGICKGLSTQLVHGQAAVERYADSITLREGLAATLEYLHVLDIVPTDNNVNVLTLALKMFLNNRLDEFDHYGL